MIWRVLTIPFLHLLDSSTARTLLQTSAKDALVPYNSLVELSKKVKETVQGNNTKLESFLSASVDSLLQEFRASLSKYVYSIHLRINSIQLDHSLHLILRRY